MDMFKQANKNLLRREPVMTRKKNGFKRIIVMLAVISMVFTNTLNSWTNTTYAATKKEVKDPLLKKTNYREMLVGDSYDFNIANKQAGMKYKWTSSDKSVATVNKVGLVKAKSVGSADITCKITYKDETYTLKAKVYVREKSKKPAKELTILDDISTMKPGYKFILNVTYKPTDTQDSINWTSSNTEVATVNRYGVITAKSPGKVSIKATSLNKSVSDKIVITIIEEGDTEIEPTPAPTETPPSPTAIPPRPTTKPPKATPTPKPSPSPSPSPYPVDEKGFDSQGRMVANFGSPIIDGNVDDIWDNAYTVYPAYVGDNVETTATFKALWDDKAIYFLAEVKDDELSVESPTPYMQDSFEVFLDENNDKTQEYGVDDLHFRVNYENLQSYDNGIAERFYTASKVIDGGYIIESRVALNDIPVNGKVLGLDLQVNEAKGPNRIGTINVFDSTGTAWNDTSKFGEIVLLGKGDDSTSGINPYNLLNLINSAKKLDQSLYSNFDVVTDAITLAETTLGYDDLTQLEIDIQYYSLKMAIKLLQLTEDAAKEKYFIQVPDLYRVASSRPGTIVSLDYSAANPSGGVDSKKLNVYLPYGYDDPENIQKYNVLYLLHGGGENENTIFSGPGQNTELKRIIDNLIEQGDIEPMIVVTPSFYGGSGSVDSFHQELLNDIIPLVETTYRTYAGSASDEELRGSRDHRAFGGFSMGSVCTWNNYINMLDYIKYFVPLSGDCWAIGGGGDLANETAEYLASIANAAGYTPTDYYIFSATGKRDEAYPNMVPQIEAMKQLSDNFIYSSDTSKGNFYFMVAEGGTHNWNWVNQYIYNILPDLFCNTSPTPEHAPDLNIDSIDEFDNQLDIAPDDEMGSAPNVEEENVPDTENIDDTDDDKDNIPDTENDEGAESNNDENSEPENDQDSDTYKDNDPKDYPDLNPLEEN